MLAKWKHEKVYFDNVVICHELRVCYYKPKTKQQSTHWVRVRSKISAENNGDHIFGSEGHDLHTLLPSWPTCEYDLLQECDSAINSSCPHSEKTAGVPMGKMGTPPRQRKATCFKGDARILCSEKDRAHVASGIQPSYLVPSDFFLFPNLKKELKGRRFSSQEEIMGTVQAILKEAVKEWIRNHVRKAGQKLGKVYCTRRGDFFEGNRNIEL